MYVACRQMKVAGRQVSPGEPVPEATTWQESVVRAHLNLGWIEKNGAPLSALAEASVAGSGAMEGAAPVLKNSKGRSKKSKK